MLDEFIRDAPEEFGGFRGFQIAPPLPFIPGDRHGDTLLLVVVHRAGPLDQAERVLQPFHEVAPIIADGTGPLPYPALNGAEQGVPFLDMDSGLREHEDIVRRYFGTIIPYNDNKFAALLSPTRSSMPAPPPRTYASAGVRTRSRSR